MVSGRRIRSMTRVCPDPPDVVLAARCSLPAPCRVGPYRVDPPKSQLYARRGTAYKTAALT